MDKNTKYEIVDLCLTLILCVMVLSMMYAFNRRLEVLECRAQVQTARIDLLNGLEITRPECLDDLLGPLNEHKTSQATEPHYEHLRTYRPTSNKTTLIPIL